MRGCHLAALWGNTNLYISQYERQGIHGSIPFLVLPSAHQPHLLLSMAAHQSHQVRGDQRTRQGGFTTTLVLIELNVREPRAEAAK